MPRQAHIVKREIVPDPVHDSTLLSKFVNCMMYGGKKSTAQRIVYGSFGIIQEKTQDDPLKLFKKAIENVKPVLEVKSRRVGGSTYQVHVAEHSLDPALLAGSWREVHGREVGGRVDRCSEQPRKLDQEEGRHASH